MKTARIGIRGWSNLTQQGEAHIARTQGRNMAETGIAANLVSTLGPHFDGQYVRHSMHGLRFPARQGIHHHQKYLRNANLSDMPTISRKELLAFLRQQNYAIQSSVSLLGAPQAALIGVIVTDDLEVFFDTLSTSRKATNLRLNPKIALVIGPTDAASVRTVQYEGIVDEPTGEVLERFLTLYFERFPDGRTRQNLPEIVYFRVKPTWLRYSDFSADPPLIVEMQGEDLL